MMFTMQRDQACQTDLRLGRATGAGNQSRKESKDEGDGEEEGAKRRDSSRHSIPGTAAAAVESTRLQKLEQRRVKRATKESAVRKQYPMLSEAGLSETAANNAAEFKDAATAGHLEQAQAAQTSPPNAQGHPEDNSNINKGSAPHTFVLPYVAFAAFAPGSALSLCGKTNRQQAL